MAAKFIFSALALASVALGICDGDITIPADSSKLAGCTTWEGNIVIDSTASGTITIDSVRRINGDLTCINATQVTAISGTELQEITGTFDLEILTILSSLQFGYLRRVNRIKWITIPAIQQLSFASGISEANQVYISDTGLTSLSGIELTQVGSMDINNNQFLKTINVNSLTNVSTFLSFSANGLDLAIELPNLEGAANLTFRNISSISMPSLAEVGGSMGFYSNYFEDLAAPNLTMVRDTIAFVDNPDLTNVSFPSLELVGGGIQLANNSALEEVTGFDNVEQIGGDISMAGVFDVITFNHLTNVRGAANVITSSQNATICDVFKDAKSKQVIKGKTTCDFGKETPETNGSASGSGSDSQNLGAAPMIPVATLTGVFGFAAALLFL